MPPKTVIKSIDHVVLTVKSIAETVQFYTEHLGMRHESFRSGSDPSDERHALVFGQQKINLHQAGKEFEPKARTPLPGSEDLCFITDTPIEEVHAELLGKGFEILENGQIVGRTGAIGKLRSIYLRDPDENLIEISNYATTG